MSVILGIMIMSTISMSIPVIITGFGNMFSEKVGIMNLGAQGMMVSGAFGAVIGSYYSGSAWIGVLVAIILGTIAAGIHAVISIEFGGNQNISGLGLNILAVGVTSYLCRVLFSNSMSPSVASLQETKILSGIPIIGDSLSKFSPIAYVAIILLLVSWVIVKKTVFGLRMTAVGDDPKTVESAGIDVWKIRYISVLICGGMAGLAGAYLSIGQLNLFMSDMVSGKGMLAVIAVKMGRWNPKRIILVAIMFGMFDAIQLQLQINNALNIPPEIIQIMPYVVGIIAIAIDSGENIAPKAMRIPYVKNKYKFITNTKA